MPEIAIENLPENLRPLMQAVQRVRAGDEGARKDLQGSAEWLLGRVDEVGQGLSLLEAPSAEAPEDQRRTWEETQARFQAGLAELEEGLHLVSVFLKEDDAYYLDTAVERVLGGARAIVSINQAWADLLVNYVPQPG